MISNFSGYKSSLAADADIVWYMAFLNNKTPKETFKHQKEVPYETTVKPIREAQNLASSCNNKIENVLYGAAKMMSIIGLKRKFEAYSKTAALLGKEILTYEQLDEICRMGHEQREQKYRIGTMNLKAMENLKRIYKNYMSANFYQKNMNMSFACCVKYESRGYYQYKQQHS